MSTTRMLIERIKAERDLTSDGQVAKALGVTRSAVSRWQKGDDAMSVESLMKASEILHLDTWEKVDIGLKLSAEHCKNSPGASAFWTEVLRIWRLSASSRTKRLTSILLAGLVGVGLNALPAQRVTAATPEAAASVCILWQIAA